MRRGFILGKFMPVHTGHIFLCETAQEMVDQLTVLVCSHDGEPMDGEQRAGWVRQSLPRANVVHMHRDIPQTPEDHPDFWPIWTRAIKEHHPDPIDIVFGSEDYVHRLAEELNARPVLIDPERKIEPVSATAIREQPAENWRYIPPYVRAHYQRRVCLLGPESSGKSVLAGHLATTFNGTLMPEYGRTYDAFYREGTGWGETDFLHLAQTHAAMRKVIARHGMPVVVEDTDAIQTAIWAEFLLPGSDGIVEALLKNLEPADFYLVLSAQTIWTDDGTRYSGRRSDREFFAERARQLVQSIGRPSVEINGTDWRARTRAAEAALSRRLAE